jgi:MFS transporter, SP family, solute carrier family 2 (facilitated glucose transporter), member 3
MRMASSAGAQQHHLHQDNGDFADNNDQQQHDCCYVEMESRRQPSTRNYHQGVPFGRATSTPVVLSSDASSSFLDGKVNRHHHLALTKNTISTERTHSEGTLMKTYTTGSMASIKSGLLYLEIPFISVHGMQKRERNALDAYAQYATSLDESSVRSEASLSQASSIRSKQQIVDSVVSSWTRPLKMAAVVIAGSQFLVGFNVAVMNSPEKYVFPGHSTESWSIAVAAFAAGGAPGAALAGKLADTKGRHFALVANFWMFLVGGLIQTMAPNLFVVTMSRFIIGVASGTSTVIAPIYMGELSPPCLRGTLGTLNQLAVVVGILAANILSFPFSTESGWRELFSITAIVSALLLLLCPFVLESPRWLLLQDPYSRAVPVVLQTLRDIPEDEVQAELESFLKADGDSNSSSTDISSKTSQLQVVAAMFRNREVRYLFGSIIFLHIAQQFSGINAVFFYSTMWFEGIVAQPLLGTLSIGIVNVISTYAAVLLMDRFDRRSLLLWSAVGMFLSCIVITIAQCQCGLFNNIVALGAVNTYVIAFELGLGPIPFLICSELFEAKYVAVAMSVSCQVNWICNTFVGLFFPTIAAALGPYSFVPFAAILFSTIFFVLFVMPETRERSIDEIMESIMNKNFDTILNGPNLDMLACGNYGGYE